MPFNYTLIKTDTLEEGDRQYWGYDLVGGAGMILNVRLRFSIPTKTLPTPAPMKGLEKELYLPGDTVAGMSGISWTQLKDENLGNNVHRYEHAYQTPGGNVLVRMVTRATIKIAQVTRIFYIDETYTVVENATLSGTDVIKSASGILSNNEASAGSGQVIDTEFSSLGDGEVITGTIISSLLLPAGVVLCRFAVAGTAGTSATLAYANVFVDNIVRGIVTRWAVSANVHFQLADVVPVTLTAGTHTFEIRASRVTYDWTVSSAALSVIH